MRPVSLKARILFGAILWTIGHFMIIAVIFLNLRHESSQWMLHPTAQRSAATAVIAGLCMYLGFLQVRRGIWSINQLRNRLAAGPKGVNPPAGGAFPEKCRPVAVRLDALLAVR